ncbi:MAG: SH3 domain-containing protein [Caldilineales bacterium]|nr:SH3 domain-containing protein [Caldilineales bacterium]MDW8318874.1 SH3 domain-containing protein [Anaerolineae bacterium]
MSVPWLVLWLAAVLAWSPQAALPAVAPTRTPTAVSIGQVVVATPVYAAPDAPAAVLGTLAAGRLVVVSEAQGDWLRIVYGGSPQGYGWVPRSAVVIPDLTQLRYLRAIRPTPTPSPTASPTPTPTPTPAAPARRPEPPLTGTLVFQTRSGGDIYLLRADGSGLRRLAAGLDPALSPDGRWVAFARWDEPRGLFLIGVDGSGERRLVGENLIKSPTWSPDGRRIAFTQQRGGTEAQTIVVPPFGEITIPADPYWRLSVVDVDSGGREDVPDDRHSFTPHWGRAGILFADGRGLQVTEPGGAARRLFTGPNPIRSARWSPDGRSIVATMQFHDRWEVVRLNADGSGLQRLTPTDRRVHSVAPAWSPDGRHIAFLTDRRGRWELWVMAADGSNPRPLAPAALAAVSFTYDFNAEQVVHWGP